MSASRLHVVERFIDCYNARDREGWLSCLAENVSVEEPVGTEVRHGRETFAAIWDLVEKSFDAWPSLEIQKLIVCGHESAVYFTSDHTRDGVTQTSHIIEIWTTGQNEELTGVRVFVDPQSFAESGLASSH